MEWMGLGAEICHQRREFHTCIENMTYLRKNDYRKFKKDNYVAQGICLLLTLSPFN
jgi:hypothetical protein